MVGAHPSGRGGQDKIQIEGIQKVRELEVEDRYKVLEFLVKEMLEIKENHNYPPPRYYDPPSYRSRDSRDHHRYTKKAKKLGSMTVDK